MSLLRSILRVKPVNRAARGAGRLLLRGEAAQRFDRRLPLLEDFSFALPNGRQVRWTPHGDINSKFLRYDGWDGYERESVRLFYDLARHAGVTLDVGAYLALFGTIAAAAREGNRAYAFEAVPSLARACRRQAANNPGLKLEVVGAAVGDAAGTVELYLPDDPTQSDTSTDPSFRPGRAAVAVPAVRLDDFIAERGLDAVDLMKVDTESTEPEVLRGMARGLRRFRPVMLIEVLNVARVEELNRFLAEYDYSAAWVHPRGLIRREAVVADPTGQAANQLFFPNGKPGPMDQIIRQRLTAG